MLRKKKYLEYQFHAIKLIHHNFWKMGFTKRKVIFWNLLYITNIDVKGKFFLKIDATWHREKLHKITTEYSMNKLNKLVLP